MTHIGRNIGRYRILEELGSGGMSVVYKGLDTALDREVAVKVLHPHLANKSESRRRLAREAKAVARLHHPNILEVFDFSAEGAQDAFLVTEYVRGRTLKECVDELGRLELPELAAMIIHELAAALAHAHEAGVIHRDLKPENVMVREDGVLKLMDFGIAKLLDIEDRMTVTGALVGSPAHMAPEIIEGHEAGAEADIFSLGTILYSLIVGRLPFTAANATATLKRILDGAYEDPRQRVPTLSDELAEICATCLARDPARRYSNAGKLRDALGDYLAGLGFARVGEELASFFADPPSYQKLMRPRIIATLLERGERLLADKRTPRALACLNQVLALDATNARALGLLQGLERERRVKLWRARGLKLGMGLVVASVLAVGLHLFQRRAPEAAPAVTSSARVSPKKVPKTAPVEKPSPPGPLEHATVTPEPARPNPEKRLVPRPEPVPREPVRAVPESVSILVRPYGYIRVDQGARSDKPLAQHMVELTPGPHTVTITCDYCEDAQETIDVRRGVENVFALRALLKRSRLSFVYEPADALVRVGGEARTVRESQERPFEIQSPRGPASFQHRVEYEVSHNGYLTEKRVANLEPGKSTTLRGALVAE
ncbi:serine/threonine-protein kinase [Archangium gephyra]|uniref:non-specific serine/threonine protein kinase n=1 Tax=Archangium gephyra TaxID=48 RepID=A0AAC8TFM3_9BACT|nr:serine/threonine-protein kinase [Archangium gephyra]AKJ04242.1 serine/threonine protein kinase [Archangium gephyra]REG37678.1 serine/threonine-protein kinase [Archangium gephyra]